MSSLQFLLASAIVAVACSYDPAYLVSTSYSQQYPKTNAVPVYCNRRTDPEYIADPKTCNGYYKCRYGKYEYRECNKEHRYDASKGDCVRDKNCVYGNAASYSTSNSQTVSTYGTSTTKAPSSTYNLNPMYPPFNPYTAVNAPNNYPTNPTNLPYNYPMNYPTNLVFNPIKQPDPAYNSAQGTNVLSPSNYQPSPAFVPPNYQFPPNYNPTNNYPINIPNLDRYPNPINPPAQSNQPNYDPINNYPINLPNPNNYQNPIYPNNLPDLAYYPNPSISPAPSKQPNYNPSNNYPIILPKRVYNPNTSNPPELFNQQPYPYFNSPTRNYQPGTPYVDPNEDPAFLPYNLANGFTSDAADNIPNNADDNENNEEPYDTANDAQNYNPPQTSYVAPTNSNPTITSNVAPPNTYPASFSNVDPLEVDLNELFNSDNAPTSYKENNLNCKDITVKSDYSNAQPNVPGVYPCNADLQCQTYAITGSCKGYFLCWNNESIYQECPEYQSFNATSGLCVNSNTCK